MEKPRKNDETSAKMERYIPPYNGFGSYEDSLGNCFSMIPQPPKTDMMKFLHYDKYVYFIGILNRMSIHITSSLFSSSFFRQGFDSYVLRFRAKMISHIPENQDRQFIIRVFLMDDTVSIFELAIRNSGKYLFQKIALH